MIIVPVDNLREGMVLAKDVSTTTATDYRTLLTRGTFLSSEMIDMLRRKGIKTVNIVGDKQAVMSEESQREQFHIPEFQAPPAEAEQEQQPVEEKPVYTPANVDEEIKNQHIGKALKELNSIFESNGEVKELSQEAVKKVSHIADDILADIGNDSTYLGNQMIALQNYDDYTYKHCLRVAAVNQRCGRAWLNKRGRKRGNRFCVAA